jgi:hypothetical protein
MAHVLFINGFSRFFSSEVVLVLSVMLPSHTRIFLTNLYVWHIFVKVHGSLRFSHLYERFKSDYQYLRAIHDVFMANIYDLFRITTDKYEQVTTCYEFFIDCYEYITKCYDSSKLFRVKYDLLSCCYELLRVFTSPYVFLQKGVLYGKLILYTRCGQFLTCQNICLYFHGSSRVFASRDGLITDTNELCTDA